MEGWRSRLILTVFGSVAIAAGIIALTPVPEWVRLDLLGSICIVGGLAMIVVALTGMNGKDH